MLRRMTGECKPTDGAYPPKFKVRLATFDIEENSQLMNVAID